MLRLEDIKPGQALQGLEPSLVVSVVAVVPLSPDSIQVTGPQTTSSGGYRRMPKRLDLSKLTGSRTVALDLKMTSILTLEHAW